MGADTEIAPIVSLRSKNCSPTSCKTDSRELKAFRWQMSESQISKADGEDSTESEPSRKKDESHVSLDEVLDDDDREDFLTVT
eukprot:763879-Hanusia_phi.AAC.3